MSDIEVYDFEFSGNCQKVRLFLSLTGQPATLRAINLAAGAQREADFLALNPFGEVPVLRDGDVILRDSQAILVYLARQYATESWLPLDPGSMGRVMTWMMVAENELARGPAMARIIRKFGIDGDIATALTVTQRILAIMEDHLAGRTWLAADSPTIADIACFPYIALAHEGGISLDAYPSIRAWLARIAALPGFQAIPGMEGI